VKPNNFGKAFSGDLVQVHVDKPAGRGGKRDEGVIVKIIERKQTDFIGTLDINNNKIAFFVHGSDKGMPDFFIPMDKLNGAQNGDRVIARFVRWEKDDRKPQGEVVAVMNAKNEGDLAMKEILVDGNFPLQFTDDVMKAAAALEDRITREEERKRKDFRDILTFTIDPVDAKDFDDAISIRNLDNGNYEIGVHIADVSHFVTPGSILDKAAYERATSVYLPDRVNPMLPERISNELCSLRPNEDKYTFSE